MRQASRFISVVSSVVVVAGLAACAAPMSQPAQGSTYPAATYPASTYPAQNPQGNYIEYGRVSNVEVLRTQQPATTSGLGAVLGGVAGVVLTARQNSGQPTAGAGIELIVIAAVVIGGTSLSGGRGSVWGSIAGALLITVINNGLNLLNVSPYFQGMFVGGLILLAVGLDWRNRKSNE